MTARQPSRSIAPPGRTLLAIPEARAVIPEIPVFVQEALLVIPREAGNLLFAFVFAFLLAIASAHAQYNLPAGTSAPDDDARTQQSSPQTGASQQQLAAAEDLLAKQDYAGAQKSLTQLTAKNPKDARALYDLGYAEDALDHTAAAETAYREAIAAEPKQFESRLALGLLLARQNDGEAASKELEAAVTLTPAAGTEAAQGAAKAEAYRALAKVNAGSKPGSALEALLSALKLSPETPQDTLLAAELAASNGDPAAAEASYRKLLQTQPDDAGAQSALAHLLVQQKKLPEAETLLASALKSHPEDPALNAQLAALYGVEGKPEQALPMLSKLHAAQPQDADITRMLADLYTQMGRPSDADPLYAALVSRGNPSADLLAARGDNLIRQKRFAEAEPVLKKAVLLKPDLADAWSGLAFAASENRDPSTTLQALSMRSKYLPDNASTLFLSATAYDSLHRNKEAADFYRKFLAAAEGKFPDQEFEARHRLVALARMR